ncbi:MAG TPA: L,D-transpeptidase family protein, partial [Longimicrobiales bacterium]|nr:L,D-transpeptidase family protein [Longimicrobiales bacterium]
SPAEAGPDGTAQESDGAAPASDQATASDRATASGSAEAPLLSLPNGDTLRLRPAVVDFYRSRGYVPAWTDDDEILPRGLRMLEAIAEANADGLDRERYHYTTAHQMARLLEEDAVEDQELEYLGNLDLLLTESFARLAQDLVVGTLDPERAGLEWRIPRGETADRDLIDAVIGGQDPRAVLAGLRPDEPYYHRLRQALERFRAIEARGGWGTVPDGETLKVGDRDRRVTLLRERLMGGDDPDEARLAGAGRHNPELFDDDLEAAVSHFQTRHTLHEDGALGPNTLDALNVPVEERIAALRLNLDRWRWLPNDLGDKFLLVNVAGFELEVVEGDSAIESMNVVVGQTANRTPIFQDTLEHMVVNPYWNVPASIAEEEILPIARRDPTYLTRNNYELVGSGSGTRVRQRPGPQNALGNVKFLFPNDMNIYLHDTPADGLFTQRSRAFSHGCIRVERPDDLARTLLAWLTDHDPSYYDELRGRGREQWVTIDEEIPVYILYFTAWADRDGTVRFHEDIYDRDETLGPERERQFAPVEPRPIAAPK